jgi:hypothetical protein
MEGSQSQCQIQRNGIVEGFENEIAMILVEGKRIKVPKAKMDSDINKGEGVRWNGKLWVAN